MFEPASKPRRLAGARSLLLAFCAVATVSCGAGDGTSSFLPPGPATTSPPGKIVIYASMAQGDRVDAYRLGTDGLMPALPFSTMHVHNPRRLALNNGVLYIATEEQILSASLEADGSLPLGPTAQTDVAQNSEPVDIVVRDGILYAAVPGFSSVESFELQNGQVPPIPTGVGQGTTSAAEYVSIALNGEFLYAGSRQTQLIDVFLLDVDGNVPVDAEDVDPQDGIALPDDIVIRDNILYVTSASDRSIRAYIIRANGTLPGDYNSRTKTEDYYSSLLLDGDTMYTSAYNAGRIDLYNVDSNGMLPEEKPIAKTHADPASYPAKMLLINGILYVAQAGLDRLDAYVIGPNKALPEYPSSSTTPAPDGPSFPTDLVALALP